MNNQTTNNLAHIIVPLNMNKLQGRMLRLPAKNVKREILFVYGHHSSLERFMPLAQELNKYGAVTMPDFPGFGGMESMYKIGEKPTLDSLADYLASFIKLRYKRRHLTIVSVGFGFLITTKMLQRYPDIAKKIDMVISIGGFVHHDDIYIGRIRRYLLKFVAGILALPIVSMIARVFLTNRGTSYYNKFRHFPHFDLKGDPFRLSHDDDTQLWRINDFRTHLKAIQTMLSIDNCTTSINLSIWHVRIGGISYLHESLIEQHLQVVFTQLNLTRSRYRFDAESDDQLQRLRQILPVKLRHALEKE